MLLGLEKFASRFRSPLQTQFGGKLQDCAPQGKKKRKEHKLKALSGNLCLNFGATEYEESPVAGLTTSRWRHTAFPQPSRRLATPKPPARLPGLLQSDSFGLKILHDNHKQCHCPAKWSQEMILLDESCDMWYKECIFAGASRRSRSM